MNTRGRETILIVDDDEVSIAILVECLQTLYRVQIAASGEQALALVTSDPPDLITLDIVMPGLDGFGTCRRIRSLPGGRDIPILFVTSLSSDHDEAAGFAAGAVDYIQKPLSPALVRARIAVHLELRRSRAELEHRNLLLLEKARLQAEVDRMTHHDLKNGLSVVLSLPERLLKDDNLTSGQQRSLELIVKAGKKMLGVMERAEDFVKLESGHLEAASRSVTLVPLVNEVVDAQRGSSEAKLLVWEILQDDAAPIEVAGDELLLYSLLSNLAKNAIEAAPEGSVLHLLTWTGTASEAGVTIRNLGAIPSEIRDHFFEKYSTYGKIGGTGLGNYTSALIAKAHGGTLEARVIEETETEIRLTLPRFIAAR